MDNTEALIQAAASYAEQKGRVVVVTSFGEFPADGVEVDDWGCVHAWRGKAADGSAREVITLRPGSLLAIRATFD